MAAITNSPAQHPAPHSAEVQDQPQHSVETSQANSVDQDLEKQEDEIPPPPSEEPAPKDPNVIEWDGPDDPGRPQNWPSRTRWIYTMILGSMTFVVTYASSVFSTATQVTAVQFGVSNEVMILGTSLTVLGFAFGPTVWAPLSEVYGRKYPLFFGYLTAGLFTIGVAVAQNLYTIMICRFFTGFFGSAPLAIIGGQLADMWDPVTRGIAMVAFAGATMIGPVLGPIVGGFVTMSYLGWRWTQYLLAIMIFFFGGIGAIFVPETLESVLLSRRAAKIRFETKNWAVRAKSDEIPVDIKALVEKYLIRPYKMLFTEPILLLVTIYISSKQPLFWAHAMTNH
jgi:MFS transporter, DHA1 family, multidrug resistance protein